MKKIIYVYVLKIKKKANYPTAIRPVQYRKLTKNKLTKQNNNKNFN